MVRIELYVALGSARVRVNCVRRPGVLDGLFVLQGLFLQAEVAARGFNLTQAVAK